jgi:hypothetical protein
VRWGIPRGARWAAWFGLFALALNALVPIHVAFDLAEAFEDAQPRGTHPEVHSAERSVLARLVGHHEADGKPREHGKGHPTNCAVCSALGAFAGFAGVAIIALPLPPPAAVPAALPAIGGQPAGVPLAYRSRAPPVA